MTKQPFLVVYGYGQGGVWAFVRAFSREEIRRRFPELEVVDDEPDWMSEEHAARISQAATLDIDRPSGLLADLIAARKGSSTGTG